MARFFHGIDLHKRYATISVRDDDGKQINFIQKCNDFRAYVQSLSSDDIVVIESINNAFYWADEIERQEAECHIVDPYKFKIIRDSWSKTDKKDSLNLSLALWMSTTREEFKLPTVYKPIPVIRELRKLFAQYQLINKQIRQYKNIIQAHLVENGIVLSDLHKNHLLNPKKGLDIYESLDLNHTTSICILMNLYLLWNIIDQKALIKREIYKAGEPLEEKVKLLISIKGVTPLLALAFLADIGDISRFTSVRKFNSYLGVVPTVKSSGGKTHLGSINRQSRNLSRSLFTQAIIHFVKSSPDMNNFYENTKARRGAGRSRIAVLRRLFSIMRRMLINNEMYRWKDDINHNNKLVDYEVEMRRIRNMALT